MDLNLILLQAGGSMQGVSTMVMMGLIFVVFYFFMIRPQQKKQKEEQKWREEVKKGDKVVTIGGMHGTVVSVVEDKIVIEPDPGVRLTFNKSSISMEGSKKIQPK
ncbi:MAG: preprotein translocase subunit YajC [Cytophagales bacterium]